MKMSEEKSFLDKLSSSPSELWKNNKLFFIAFGAIILIIKFRSLLVDLIVSDSKKVFGDAKKQSDVFKGEEDSANKKANELVAKADQKLNNRPTVDEDWNKKG